MGDANGPATARQEAALYREIIEGMVDVLPYRERARAFRKIVETLRAVHEQAGRGVPHWLAVLAAEGERQGEP